MPFGLIVEVFGTTIFGARGKAVTPMASDRFGVDADGVSLASAIALVHASVYDSGIRIYAIDLFNEIPHG